jgi:two-component system alkaline phosphatase synthesis response regulator PhoP
LSGDHRGPDPLKVLLDGGGRAGYNGGQFRGSHGAGIFQATPEKFTSEQVLMTEASGNTPVPASDILIVDDNAQNAELLQAYLEPLDCHIRIAEDGIEAMKQVAQSPPDIILLDIMMPRMSGFEVCRRLKGDPATQDIPVVMVTALNELADIERGVDSGADDFLSKPINKLELITRVKSLLRVRHLKSELERTLSYLADLEEEENRNSGS